MVEGMHQQLKAALIARRSSTSWPSKLPWVLLGLRSSPLEDSSVSFAELVYGTLPSLPGQFLSTPELPPSEFLDNLHHLMDPFVPPPLVHCSSPPSSPVHLLTALWEAEYAFVRLDGLWRSLTPLYDGPHKVVRQSSTFFCLAIGDCEDSVLVSCLKPLLASGPVEPALPRHHGSPPQLKPRPTPPAVPRQRGRPKKDPPPSLPTHQLRCGHSAGLNPAQPVPEGPGGKSCNGSETPCINMLVIELLLYNV